MPNANCLRNAPLASSTSHYIISLKNGTDPATTTTSARIRATCCFAAGSSDFWGRHQGERLTHRKCQQGEPHRYRTRVRVHHKVKIGLKRHRSRWLDIFVVKLARPTHGHPRWRHPLFAKHTHAHRSPTTHL